MDTLPGSATAYDGESGRKDSAGLVCVFVWDQYELLAMLLTKSVISSITHEVILGWICHS